MSPSVSMLFLNYRLPISTMDAVSQAETQRVFSVHLMMEVILAVWLMMISVECFLCLLVGMLHFGIAV